MRFLWDVVVLLWEIAIQLFTPMKPDEKKCSGGKCR